MGSNEVGTMIPATGYVFTIAECVISWKAELQDIITFSKTEAEYMAAVEA